MGMGLKFRMGMGMKSLKWEGIGTKNLFPHTTSSGNWRRVDEAVHVAGQVGVAPGPAARVAGGRAHVRAAARLRRQQSVDARSPDERTSHAAYRAVGLPREPVVRPPGTAPLAVAAAAAAVSVGADDRPLQYLQAAPRTSTPHHPHRRRKVSVVGGTMAIAEHEPITGVWGQSPQRGPGAETLIRGSGGRSPLKLKAFWSLDVQRSRQI